MMNTTRESLLIRIRDREDQDAWVEFDVIYRPILRRFALERQVPTNEVEDVVQDCMVAIQKYISGFDYDPHRGRFRAWLRKMVNNRIINIRRRRREQQVDSGHCKDLQASGPDPEETFERIWIEEHLKHALRWVRSRVDATTFAAFQRHVMEEQAVQEVCDALGLKAARIYKIKWRVTELLRERMLELTGEDP